MSCQTKEAAEEILALLKNSNESDLATIALRLQNSLQNSTEVSETSKKTDYSNLSTKEINFEASKSADYKVRTSKNAQADATLAMGVDFTTAGEKLTQNKVGEYNKQYIRVDTKEWKVTDKMVNTVIDNLNNSKAQTLNIAGNGIYTNGMKSQQEVDNFVYELLSKVLPKLDTPLELVRSGGQTGFDEAGIKAANRLGIKTLVLAPKDWKYKDVNGVTITNEKQFKQRFMQPKQSEADEKPLTSDGETKMETVMVYNYMSLTNEKNQENDYTFTEITHNSNNATTIKFEKYPYELVFNNTTKTAVDKKGKKWSTTEENLEALDIEIATIESLINTKDYTNVIDPRGVKMWIKPINLEIEEANEFDFYLSYRISDSTYANWSIREKSTGSNMTSKYHYNIKEAYDEAEKLLKNAGSEGLRKAVEQVKNKKAAEKPTAPEEKPIDQQPTDVGEPKQDIGIDKQSKEQPKYKDAQKALIDELKPILETQEMKDLVNLYIDKEANFSTANNTGIKGVVKGISIFGNLVNQNGYTLDIVSDIANDFRTAKNKIIDDYKKKKLAEEAAKPQDAINKDEELQKKGESLTTDNEKEDTIESKQILGSSPDESKGTLTDTIVVNVKEDLFSFLQDSVDEAMRSGALTGEHLDQLEKVVAMIEDLLVSKNEDKFITAELYESNIGDIRGTASIDDNKISITDTGNSDFFNKPEVALHEMIHILTHRMLNTDRGLRKKVKVLRETAKRKIEAKFNGDGYKVFLTDKPNPTSEQVATAKKLFDYAFYHGGTDPESEFLAYASTNKYVSAALEGIQVEDKLFEYIKIEPTFDKQGRVKKSYLAVINTIIKAINEMYTMMKYDLGKHKDMLSVSNELLSVLMRKQVEADQLARQPAPLPGVLDKLHEYEDKFRENVLDKIYGDKVTQLGTTGLDIRTPVGLKKWIKNISDAKMLRGTKDAFLTNNILTTAFTDTTDPKNAWFYDLFRNAKRIIEKDVHDMTSDVLQGLIELGLQKVPLNYRKATKRVLIDTDARAIHKDTKQLIKIIEDPKVLEAEIAAYNDLLKPFTIRVSENLGKKLALGIDTSRNAYSNAYEIYNASYSHSGEPDKTSLQAIDRLASLYAIKYSGVEDKALTVKALKEYPTELQDSINILYGHQDELVTKVYEGQSKYVEKGMKQEKYESFKSFQIVPAKERKSLEKLGWKEVGKHDELSQISGEDFYIMIGNNIDTNYSQGALSTIQLHGEGLSMYVLLKESGKTTEEIEKIMKKLLDREIIVTSNQYMTPVRMSGSNMITDYRIRLSYEQKEQFMGIDHDMLQTIATTASNFTHKENSVVNNVGLINALTAHAELYRSEYPEEFIELRASTEAEIRAGKEYKYARKWAIIPSYTKDYILKKNGAKSLWVPKHLLVDFTGRKDWSVTQLPGLKNAGALKVAVRKAEQLLQEIVARNKKILILFTGSTITGNYLSNLAYALEETRVSPTVLVPQLIDMWEDINLYNKEARELGSLKATFSKNTARIKELTNNLEKNPVHGLAMDGQLGAIISELDVNQTLSDGNGASLIRTLLDKSPKAVKETFKQLYFDDRTLAAKSLTKLTRNSDTLFRAVIAQHYINEMKTKPKDKWRFKTKQDVYRFVDQKFTNPAYLASSGEGYLNSLGAPSFLPYFLKTLPGVIKHIYNNPVTTVLFEGLQALTFNISTPLDGYFNVIKTLNNKIMLDDPMDMFSRMVTPVGMNLFK